MEKYKPGVTLQEAIKEAQEDRDIFAIADPQRRAAAIADWVRREYPFAWQLRTMQDAAARAVGVPTQRELEKEYEEVIEEEEIEQFEEEAQQRDTAYEVNRLGLSLLGASGLCVIGELWPGAAGLAIAGISAIALAKALDNQN